MSSIRNPVCTSICPHKKKQFQVRIVIATGGTLGLAEWIIDDTCLVFSISACVHTVQKQPHLNAAVLFIVITVITMSIRARLLIHSANPQLRPVVIIVFAHVVRTYVLTYFSKSSQSKPVSSENNVHYWRDCGYGRVDH